MKFDAAAITWYVLSNWHIIRVLALRRECISIEPWLNSFVWFSLTAVKRRATFHFTFKQQFFMYVLILSNRELNRQR